VNNYREWIANKKVYQAQIKIIMFGICSCLF
jgi:hypothetical protein